MVLIPGGRYSKVAIMRGSSVLVLRAVVLNREIIVSNGT